MKKIYSLMQGLIETTMAAVSAQPTTPIENCPNHSPLILRRHWATVARLAALLPILLLSDARSSYAEAYIVNGSATAEVQASDNCRQQKEGIYANGYMKYITDLTINCSGEKISPVSAASYWYSIGDANNPLTSNKAGTTFLGGTPLNVSGEIITAASLKNKKAASKIIGMLYNDSQNLIGSWLIVKGFDMPPSDLSKVRAKLTKSLRANKVIVLTQLSGPVWLFRVKPDFTLALEP